MAVQAWTDMSVLFGSLDLACYAKNVEAPAVQANVLDTTAVCVSDDWETAICGIKSVTWSAEVMQDFAADKVDALTGLSGSTLAASTPLSVLPAGVTDGSLAYTFRANQLQYTPLQAQVGELAMASLGGKARQGPVVRGTVLHPPSTARTTTANGTGRQLGALTAAQSLYVALHVTAASGTSPTLDIIVESDDNSGFTTPTTRATLTQVTATGWQWAAVAGAITDDYWRIGYTIGGTTPSFEFCVVAGIATTV